MVPGPGDSLDPLYALHTKHVDKFWSADTETTGKYPWAPGYSVRIVQVGIANQAWVLRPEWFLDDIYALTRRAWWHNAPFDAVSLFTAFGFDPTETMEGARDSSIYSRLLDPRDPSKGGVGHRLKDLGEHLLELPVKDEKKELVRVGRAMKIKAADIWRDIPVDNEEYQRYAGQDVLLTARIAAILETKVKQRKLERFVMFEHALARRAIHMRVDGTRVDRKYAGQSRQQLLDYVDRKEADLEKEGVVKTSAAYFSTSSASIMSILKTRGAKFTKVSEKTGKPSLDASVLEEIRDKGGDAGELARLVLEAKKAKHYADYMAGLLELSQRDGRIHPSINTLQAATARMSISDPPLQQYPQQGVELDDGLTIPIRHAIMADPGEVLISADFAQVEFRVAAAVSGDPVMRARILAGDDLHAITAEIMFGPDFTREERDIVKRVGFGRLYRGTVRGISRQTGLPVPLVKKGTQAFDAAYPHTAKWGDSVQEYVRKGNTTVVTITGRPLIVEAPWAAVNYMVQSPARDVFAQGILNLHKTDLGKRLRLVVHDEVILSVPKRQAEKMARQVEECMNTTLRGIPITTEAKVVGPHWKKG
jgi:DNA polymerase-1